MTQFIQRAMLFYRTEFNFGEREIEFVLDGEKNRVGFAVRYEQLPDERTLQSFTEKWPRSMFFVFFFGLIMSYVIFLWIASNSVHPTYLVILSLLAMICVCAFLQRFMKRDAVVLKTPQGNILVIEDDRKQSILEELKRRRIAALRRLHGQVDLLNGSKAEMEKFDWLKNTGVIDEQEHRAAIEEIRAANAPGGNEIDEQDDDDL